LTPARLRCWQYRFPSGSRCWRGRFSASGYRWFARIFILIGGNGIEAGTGKLPGFLLALAGAICVGPGTVLTKHFPLAVPPLPLAAWQIGIGCLPVALSAQ
jgi:drug/metabolite transporter (DMT)-like permease